MYLDTIDILQMGTELGRLVPLRLLCLEWAGTWSSRLFGCIDRVGRIVTLPQPASD